MDGKVYNSNFEIFKEPQFAIDLTVVDDPALEKFPKTTFPNLKKIQFWKFGNYRPQHSKSIHYHLHSFKDLPEKIPKLERIDFNYSNISNFEELIADTPNLKTTNFYVCHIRSFHGFPKNINLTIEHSTINSFEGLDFSILPTAKESQIKLENCTIFSLGGVSRTTLQAILVAILSKDYEKYDKDDRLRLKLNLKKSSHPQIRCNLQLPPTALTLVNESINQEIEHRYSPKHNENWPYIHDDRFLRIPPYYIDEWQLYEEDDNYLPRSEQIKSIFKFQWIYGFNLMERLFIPENLDLLHEYYRKTTQQLAQDYIASPENMPPELIERLVHEVDPELRKMLENNLPPSDTVIEQISAKFAFRTENGLTILK